MRGKRCVTLTYAGDFGITPAHAGKTTLGIIKFVINQDHPRACGENSSSTFDIYREPGSPPRMRGKLIKSVCAICRLRITPADAGKTDREYRYRIPPEDHPRGCGENGITTLWTVKVIGSPPRMRGKLILLVFLVLRSRITPADAGKTCYNEILYITN